MPATAAAATFATTTVAVAAHEEAFAGQLPDSAAEATAATLVKSKYSQMHLSAATAGAGTEPLHLPLTAPAPDPATSSCVSACIVCH